MEKHKKNALEDKCLCTKCEFRFQCFTQERIFSDPILQGLFEALMAKGVSKEEALDQVTNEIKFRINLPKSDPVTIPEIPWSQDSPNYNYPYTIWAGDINISMGSGVDNGINDDDADNNIQISYTMGTGDVVNWSI